MSDFVEIIKPTLLVLLGFLLSTIKDLLNFRKTDKGALKLCLSNLLEVYYIIQKTDVVEISDRMLSHLGKEFPEIVVDGKIYPLFKRQFEENIHIQVVDTILSRFPKIKEDYDKSLEGLKSIDPLLAHKLSGRTELAKYVNAIESYLIQMSPELQDNAMKNELMKFVSPRIRIDLLEITEDDILTVARKIGFRTHSRAKKQLNTIKQKWDDNKDVQEFYSELKERFQDGVGALPELDSLQSLDFTDQPNGKLLTQLQGLILESKSNDLDTSNPLPGPGGVANVTGGAAPGHYSPPPSS